jgi:DNA invertase Pin-like site-specific DNA recombinase
MHHPSINEQPEKHTLDKKHVSFQVLDQQIDTSTATDRLLLHMLGTIAAFENELRKERQYDGIVLAKDRGVILGRNAF